MGYGVGCNGEFMNGSTLQTSQKDAMKHYAALAVVACSTCTAAYAQQVQLYGILDAAVEVLQTDSAGQTNRQVLLTGNNLYSSRIGLKGREDLGDGLFAVFKLEMGFLPDTGALTFSGRAFGIQSSIGLENAKNRFLAGRLLHPFVDVSSGFDPQFYRRYSITSQDPGLGPLVHPDKSIRYTRIEGPFQFDVFHSFGFDTIAAPIGGVAGGTAQAKDTAYSVKYEDKNFAANLAFDRLGGPLSAGTDGVGYIAPSTLPKTSVASDHVKRYLAALRYTLNSTTVYGGYRHLESTVAGKQDAANLSWVGVKQEVSPIVTLAAGVYRQNVVGLDARATSYVVSGVYKLSKRTSFYANASSVSNSPFSVIGIGAAQVAPGASQKGLQLGILHFF